MKLFMNDLIYCDESTEAVDFENNGAFWLPPEAEDEDDEREATSFNDDDDEEHNNPIKNVLDRQFRALVAKFLQGYNLSVGEEGDKESWLEVVTSLVWRTVTLLKTHTSTDGGMDPTEYVKIKCLPCGRRSDSTVVKGVVCKNNVAHHRMTSNLEMPRILILGGALEYRVSNVRASFDTPLQHVTEMDHLKMAVAKIDSHHPDILLVEKSVSRYVQEYLLANDISLVLNVKGPLLKRIARCTGGQIVPSIDQLSSQTLGYCDKFYVKRFLIEHGTAGKKLVKTLIYFEGCPKPLGCTVLLRGVNGDELRKLKYLVENVIFEACNLVLETSFLADEGASLRRSVCAYISFALVGREQEEFPRSRENQSILVLLSSQCVCKGTICEASHVSRIEFYGKFDKPLGRYLCDHLFDQGYRCRVCGMPSEAHVQCYTHHQGTLTISVKKLPEILLPGEEVGNIWMWHRCLRCPLVNGVSPANRRILLSDAAFSFSFGKFLQLGFSNHAAASRVADCGHSLHRDCLQFYGFGQMVACFRYASIDVHSVYLPPTKLEFDYENHDWIQNEVNQVVGKAALMFSDVNNSLRMLGEKISGIELPNSMNICNARCQIADLESRLQREKDDFEKSVENIENKEMRRGQHALDILEINQLRRQLFIHSYLWDHSLQYAAATLDNNAEDTMSLLGIPFNVQKLENLKGYNPVYMSSLWESETQGGSRYMFPVGVYDTVVPVYDDEPTSIISYALVSPEYLVQISDKTDDEVLLQSYTSLVGEENYMPTASPKTLHAKVLFDHPFGQVKYNVTCYYANRFEELRKICCPSEMDYVRSLSRCKKGGNQGAKRDVFFAKTLDERFIIKQVTKTELESFFKFAPEYFKYLSKLILPGNRTCLAKILGIYQVTTKTVEGGKELKMDLLVMENLLYARNATRLYHLQGSSRLPYNPNSSGNNNLIEAMPTFQIFVRKEAKRQLERAIWTDASFLASIDVTDYSLLVGINEEKHEVAIGITGFMKQYTLWEKYSKTWGKAFCMLDAPENTSPPLLPSIEYKKKFKKAMFTYFHTLPGFQ